MLVVVSLFELHIPYSRSLKDKRMVVRSLRDQIRNRFEIAVSEVAFHDLHQRARLAATFIALDPATADRLLEKLRTFVESNTDAMLSGWTTEKLDFDENVQI